MEKKRREEDNSSRFCKQAANFFAVNVAALDFWKGSIAVSASSFHY